MNAKDVIRQTMGLNENIMNSYLADLEDADLLLRPVEGQNHIAWQLGHLIESERQMVEGIKPGTCPPLPEGFAESHNRDATKSDDPKQFWTKQQYLELFNKQREATKKLLEEMADAELDAPAPERIRRMCPTVGATFNLIGGHVGMHVGQFVSVRRKLGKPVAI